MIVQVVIFLFFLTSLRGQYSGNDVLCQQLLAQRGYGYYPVPGTCSMYVLCSYSQNLTQYCPSGTFWSTVINNCQQVHVVDCQYDPCKTYPDRFRYPDVDSCMNYYECHGQRSHHANCQPGERFDEDTKDCVLSRFCQQKQRYCNELKRPTHDPHKFYAGSDLLGWSLMSCPGDLVYSAELCQCTYLTTAVERHTVAATATDCVHDFYFSYSGHLHESQGRVHQAALGSVIVNGDKALFRGAGSLEIPSLGNSDFRPEFALSFKFRVTSSDPKRQNGMALVGNGCNGAKGTLRMFLKGNTVVLEITTTNGENAEMFHQRKISNVIVNLETTVHLMRNETRIRFMVAGREATPIYTHMYIKPITCALAIGMGNGLDNFVGEFDDLLFYRCIPEGFMATQSLEPSYLPTILISGIKPTDKH